MELMDPMPVDEVHQVLYTRGRLLKHLTVVGGLPTVIIGVINSFQPYSTYLGLELHGWQLTEYERCLFIPNIKEVVNQILFCPESYHNPKFNPNEKCYSRTKRFSDIADLMPNAPASTITHWCKHVSTLMRESRHGAAHSNYLTDRFHSNYITEWILPPSINGVACMQGP